MAQKGIPAMDEKKWQAEDDARTLIRAEEIKADKARYDRAMKAVAKEKKAVDKTAAAAARGVMSRK
jgi:hypothetical protein